MGVVISIYKLKTMKSCLLFVSMLATSTIAFLSAMPISYSYSINAFLLRMVELNIGKGCQSKN